MVSGPIMSRPLASSPFFCWQWQPWRVLFPHVARRKSIPWKHCVMNDLRFAFRQLLKNPGFAAVAVLTLAVGIGATTAVFTIINGVLLRPPPYTRPEELALITPAKVDGGTYSASCSGAQFADWQVQADSFAAMAAYQWTFNFLVHPDGSESLEGLGCSAQLFRVLGLQPVLGRTFNDQEKLVRDQPVVILGHGL